MYRVDPAPTNQNIEPIYNSYKRRLISAMNTVKVDLTSKMFDRYVVLVCSSLFRATASMYCQADSCI